jgi:hypothetical protein
MRDRAPADKRRVRRLAILACTCLLGAAGCGGHNEAGVGVPSLAAAKVAVERDARRHYGDELVVDQLVCSRSPDGMTLCSISFAPLPSRPARELCETYAVVVDPVRGIELAPMAGTCYFTGGASGSIEVAR